MVQRSVPVPDAAAPGRSRPVRTCVGCRLRDVKTALIRFVLVEGHVVPDLAGRMPGRGASLHPSPECLELAERRRAFTRALRAHGPVDLTAVRDQVEAHQQYQ